MHKDPILKPSIDKKQLSVKYLPTRYKGLVWVIDSTNCVIDIFSFLAIWDKILNSYEKLGQTKSNLEQNFYSN